MIAEIFILIFVLVIILAIMVAHQRHDETATLPAPLFAASSMPRTLPRVAPKGILVTQRAGKVKKNVSFADTRSEVIFDKDTRATVGATTART